MTNNDLTHIATTDSGGVAAVGCLPVTPYPLCSFCHRSPLLHYRSGKELRCREKGQAGDFGPATYLVVASVYGDVGWKMPRSLVDEVMALRRQGVETW